MHKSTALLIGLLGACQPTRAPSGVNYVAPPGPSGTVTLKITAHLTSLELAGRALPVGRIFHVVSLTLTNQRTSPVSGSYQRFRLVTDTTGGAHRPAPESATIARSCADAAQIAVGATLDCDLVFETASDRQPMHLDYDSGAGATAEASFAGIQPPTPTCPTMGPEDTLAACSDNCNNDGDPYQDCGDSDCCAVRPDCPTDSYCGANAPACVLGPEARYSTCTDSCDNDGDGANDCEDADCCSLVACPANTFCGTQSDPFAGPVVFDDAALARLDPATLIGGATPCRPPVLVEVQYARDGDTLEVLVPSTGNTEVIRIIGANTPELAHPGQALECYGPEASVFTRQFVGHRAWLTFDNDCLDPYDRTLAYAYFGPDSTSMLERQLLRRGFARVLAFRATATFEALFAADEAAAAAQGVGLHSACP